MKKCFLIPVMLLVAMVAQAQFNLQLHYDLGKATNPDSEADRQLFTTTAEFFNADKLGTTFMFIDLDYRKKIGNSWSPGVLGAYWEVSRDFTFAKVKNTAHSFSAHAEYDGGMNQFGAFQQALLVGPAWSWHSKDFSKTWTLQAMYKQFIKHGDLRGLPSVQLTGVWGLTFAHGWCTFSGFADVWYSYIPEFKADGVQKKGFVFLTEPQFWVNVLAKAETKQKFAIGTEWEISNNFIWSTAGDRSVYFNPTIAAKYTF